MDMLQLASFLLNQNTESRKVHLISSDVSKYKASLRLSCIMVRRGRIVFERDQIIKPYKARLFQTKYLRLKFQTFNSSIIFNHRVAGN
jgi:hypothetical protein